MCIFTKTSRRSTLLAGCAAGAAAGTLPPISIDNKSPISESWLGITVGSWWCVATSSAEPCRVGNDFLIPALRPSTNAVGGLWYTLASDEIWQINSSSRVGSSRSVSSDINGLSARTTSFAAAGSVLNSLQQIRKIVSFYVINFYNVTKSIIPSRVANFPLCWN